MLLLCIENRGKKVIAVIAICTSERRGVIFNGARGTVIRLRLLAGRRIN